MPGFAHCDAMVRTDAYFKQAPAFVAHRYSSVAEIQAHPNTASGWYTALDPKHIQQAYDLPSTTHGSGQIVGIVDAYSDPTAVADVTAYRSHFSLPACTTGSGCLKIVNEKGLTSPTPPPDTGWAGEISLDLDMVSAVCPLCHIVLVEAQSNSFADLGASVLTAHKLGATQISNSYGGGENGASNPDYNIPGAVVTASAGDSSWYNGPQNPCSYSTVVCVGGTALYSYNNTRGWFETVWGDIGNSNLFGTGSGCSQVVPKPTWQTAVASCAGGKRAETDVSAIADPFNPGVLVYQNYGAGAAGLYIYGGTSVASPIIASTFALAGNAKTTLNAKNLWYYGSKSSTALNDITVGANGAPGFVNAVGQYCTPVLICYAMPGYDGPTGNGTPWGIGAF